MLLLKSRIINNGEQLTPYTGLCCSFTSPPDPCKLKTNPCSTPSTPAAAAGKLAASA